MKNTNATKPTNINFVTLGKACLSLSLVAGSGAYLMSTNAAIYDLALSVSLAAGVLGGGFLLGEAKRSNRLKLSFKGMLSAKSA